MKRLVSCLIVLLFMLVIDTGISQAYTMYFGFDDSMDLSHLSGFQFDITGVDESDLTLTVYHQSDSVPAIVGGGNGAVPDQSVATFPWDIQLTRTPGVYAYNNGGNSYPLQGGLVLSLEANDSFELSNLILADNNDSEGKYRKPFSITQEQLSNGDTMVECSAVPVPPSLLLMASGLVGLIGLGRKRILR